MPQLRAVRQHEDALSQGHVVVRNWRPLGRSPEADQGLRHQDVPHGAARAWYI
eukprot:CAMPEP_0179147608 /NCGR_PEP_ID=MMETSP0796-20121207/71366_1 /TAXON_ID=73915 /ORGANISM="Pyrodinium bahamense, Strain pbaha01" /LENGTH=52 /DNA_ID=CAMNT_0020848221 /DNA_START=238 /DNA_END=396 /DNA_ORIENTATION=-